MVRKGLIKGQNLAGLDACVSYRRKIILENLGCAGCNFLSDLKIRIHALLYNYFENEVLNFGDTPRRLGHFCWLA